MYSQWTTHREVKRTVEIGLVLWLGAVVVVGGLLLLGHTPLAIPSSGDAVLRDGLRTLGSQDGRWRTAHMMYRSCTCSKRTIEHLLARRPILGVDEHVVMVDDDGAGGSDDQALRDAGYAVHVITPQQLRDRFALHSAPVLVVAKPDGSIAYVGGYNRHKQEPRYMDVAIVHDLLDGPAVPLPVFGCSTSARLARSP